MLRSILPLIVSLDILNSIRYHPEILHMGCNYGGMLFCLFSPLPLGDRTRLTGRGFLPLTSGQPSLNPSALCRHNKHLARQRNLQQGQDEQAHQA
jgi:hypothetical protein